jgi:phosphohistidine phosphatase SixA
MAKTRKNRGGWSFNPLKWFKRKPISATTNNVYEPIQPQGQQLQAQSPAQTSNPNDNEYHLVVSHNNRIQSWINKLLITDTYYEKIFDKHNKMRFSNGASISLSFHLNTVYISLIYAGDTGSNKPGEPYWGTETNGNIINFLPFKTDIMTFKKLLEIKDDDSIRNLRGKKFLIVRHGEATHNLKRKPREMFYQDTLLTSNSENVNETYGGIQQSMKLGEVLKGKNIKINKNCYVSDLIRTGMTAWAIGTEFFNDEDSFDKYIVVPCNHEVPKEEGDPYYIPWRNIGSVQNENKTDCKGGDNRCPRCFYFKEEENNDDYLRKIGKFRNTVKCLLDENGNPIQIKDICGNIIMKNVYGYKIKNDNSGNPIIEDLKKNPIQFNEYKYKIVDLTKKYDWTFYDDFKRIGKNCKNNFFQQLNKVFETNETNTIEEEDEKEDLGERGYFLYQNQVHLSTGGSNYKRSKKMKYRKKFTKKGGKKSKVRKTSKPSKK